MGNCEILVDEGGGREGGNVRGMGKWVVEWWGTGGFNNGGV